MSGYYFFFTNLTVRFNILMMETQLQLYTLFSAFLPDRFTYPWKYDFLLGVHKGWKQFTFVLATDCSRM